MPWVELHAHSDLSFLVGASSPEDLVEQAARLGLGALAITDHDGLYAAIRLRQAAAEAGVGTVFGSELTLSLPGTKLGSGPGGHLVVLARSPAGYRSLSQVIAAAHLAGAKGQPVYDWDLLAAAHEGQWLVLTGGRASAVPVALLADGPRPSAGAITAAGRCLDQLVGVFGHEGVRVEVWDHDQPGDGVRNEALIALAARAGVQVVATNQVHYARPADGRLAAAFAALRRRNSLEEAAPWLPAHPAAYLRSGTEMAARWARHPQVITNTLQAGEECAFALDLLDGALPAFAVPAGYDEDSWLRHLAHQGTTARYGPQAAPRVPGSWEQLEHELKVIQQLGLAGYFLTVADIAAFCHQRQIACQGRGSAANSTLCYALGITRVDPIRYALLFERFLSPERDGPPDIDLDIESDRREEVIQYVYDRYGREHAAQVANVITYRPKLAVRDAARALGYSVGQQDAWTQALRRGTPLEEQVEAGIPAQVLELAQQALGHPRHLGIHSGGMVITARPIAQICPVQWAAMPGRSILQWDKDDVAAAGLIKIDLLGLGMLAALRDAVELAWAGYGQRVDLADLPPDDAATYAMIQAADTVGVFQIESRAQMATLPRLKPRTFSDLVAAVALIRPGPIQGGAVHPYIRRRNGQEAWAVPHPLLERALAKTYGIPLFQEQLMQIAIDAAGFSGGEADQLRQALGAKRSSARLARLRERLTCGMISNGIEEDLAGRLYEQVAAFANYGFPESHAISFAHLVYASAYLKCHYPAAFTAGLLRNQPMGFYSPQSLVADARRRGITVCRPHVNGPALTTIDTVDAAREGGGHPSVLLGLDQVRGLSSVQAEQIAAAGPFASLRDLAKLELPTRVVETLAESGTLTALTHTTSTGADPAAEPEETDSREVDTGRRAALWTTGVLAHTNVEQLELEYPAADAPGLPGMTPTQVSAADLRTLGITPTSHPMQHLRPLLDSEVVTAAALRDLASGTRARVAGVVTHRQAPPTAGGVVFMNVEDETGMANIVFSPGAWERLRAIALGARALLLRGTIQSADGVVNLLAEHAQVLPVPSGRARDFH